MRVERIELFHVAIPLARPLYPAWIPGYPQAVNRFTLLRLTTGDGVQGVAAGVAFEQEREGLGGLLGPYLIGLDPTDIDTARQRIREASVFRDHLPGHRRQNGARKGVAHRLAPGAQETALGESCPIGRPLIRQ